MAELTDILSEAEKLANAHEKELKVDDAHMGGFEMLSIKHPLYNDTVNLSNQLAVHYIWGTDASELITQARPYEPDLIRKYRKDAYEQETFPHGQRILGLVKGALSHPQLFSIDYPPLPNILTPEESMQTYVNSLIPIDNVRDLDTYFWEFIFPMGMVDPNAWVAVLQRTPDSALAEDLNTFRDPYPEFVPSSHVLDYSTNHALVLTTEYKEYKKGQSAPVFFFFTSDLTLKVIPDGEETKGGVRYKAEIWHNHGYGEMQIHQVGGMISGVTYAVLSSSQSFHLSHLQPTIPAFNKVVRYLSDLDATFVMHMHPVKVEEMIECDDCVAGFTKEGDTCQTCKGSGLVSPGNSALSGYSKLPNEDGKLESPVMFVSPDPTIFSEARSFVEKKLIEAYEGVNAAFLIKQSTGQQEAARSRELQREPLLLWFRQVAGTTYPLYQWILDMINRIRYEAVLGSDYKENSPTVIQPSSFDTAALNLVMEELVTIKQTDLPASVVNKISQNALQKRFGSENRMTKVMLAYMQVDVYATFTEDEFLVLQASEGVDPINIFIHNNVIDLVNRAIKETNQFLEIGEIEKREIIYELAKKTMEALSSTEDADPEPTEPTE